MNIEALTEEDLKKHYCSFCGGSGINFKYKKEKDCEWCSGKGKVYTALGKQLLQFIKEELLNAKEEENQI